nr:SpaH/EbpB family LPXTG-anchored major pilin [Leucobacter edaphi]
MHHPPRSVRSRPAAALVAALVFLSALIPGTAALAEPPGGLTGTSGDLVIHKHAGTPGAAGNGQEITDTSALGIGLRGVQFTIARVSYDGTPISLTEAAGWDLAKNATLPLSGRYSSAPIAGGPIVTDASGTATAAALPYGLYLVTETSAGPNTVTAPAQPFLVTVPYPNETTGGWLTRVHVYPKNQLADSHQFTAGKPAKPVLGDPITWTATVSVPRPSSGSTYTRFAITDKLDPRLQFTGVTVTRDGVPLTEGVDYTVTAPTPGNGNTVTVTPTLASVRTGQNYSVQVTTRVTGTGEIVNSATRIVNDVETALGPAQTNWGALRLVKHAQGSQDALKGAQFELYAADRTTLLVPAQETGGDGSILFPGLWVGNDATKSAEFCLKETRAPAGYVLPADPWTCRAIASSEPSTRVEWSVTNARHTGLPLPLTGGAGTTTLLAGGAVLVLSAAVWGTWGARRRRAEA